MPEPLDIDLDKFYFTSRLGGHDELYPMALFANEHGKELEVDESGEQVVVRDLQTRRWLALPFDVNFDEEVLRDTIEDFDAQYDALVPLDDQGQNDDPEEMEWESLPNRIVDILLEAIDPNEFVQDFSKSQERVGGRPLTTVPTGKKIVRAVVFRTGHRLYLWRTRKRREHYGEGPASYYLGYRFVLPNGTILFEGGHYHPGAVEDPLGDQVITMLMQSLCLNPKEHEEEFFENYTPEQLEWANSDDREIIEMDVQGHDGFEEGYPPPWKDLPGYEYTPAQT